MYYIMHKIESKGISSLPRNQVIKNVASLPQTASQF